MDTLISASDHDDPCELWSGSDISAIATSYSQLASVLAGFAFVAMTLVMNRSYRPPLSVFASLVPPPEQALSNNDDEEQHDKRVLIALGCAFVSLIVAAVEYAFLSGERGCALTRGRASSVEVLAGVAFIFAIYLLLYSFVQLVSSSTRQLGRNFRFLVIVVVPPLAMLFMVAALSDMAISLGTKGHASQPLWDDAHTASFWIPVTLGGFSLICWLVGFRMRREEAEPPAALSFALTYLPYVPLTLLLTTVSWSVTLPEDNPTAHISPWQAWMWVYICAAVLALQSALLSFESKAEYKLVATPAEPPTPTPAEKASATIEVQPQSPSTTENLSQMMDGIHTTAAAFVRLVQRR